MPLFTVHHDYRSSRGVLEAGATVDLADDEAEWFNADSPGVLEPAGDDNQGGVPKGNVDDIVAWVRGSAPDEEPAEGWDERAQEALDAELAGKDRPSLVKQLKAVLAPPDDPNA